VISQSSTGTSRRGTYERATRDCVPRARQRLSRTSAAHAEEAAPARRRPGLVDQVEKAIASRVLQAQAEAAKISRSQRNLASANSCCAVGLICSARDALSNMLGPEPWAWGKSAASSVPSQRRRGKVHGRLRTVKRRRPLPLGRGSHASTPVSGTGIGLAEGTSGISTPAQRGSRNVTTSTYTSTDARCREAFASRPEDRRDG